MANYRSNFVFRGEFVPIFILHSEAEISAFQLVDTVLAVLNGVRVVSHFRGADVQFPKEIINSGSDEPIPPTDLITITLTGDHGSFVVDHHPYLHPVQVSAGEHSIAFSPEEGYEFESWSDGDTSNPRTINSDVDIDLSVSVTEVTLVGIGVYSDDQPYIFGYKRNTSLDESGYHAYTSPNYTVYVNGDVVGSVCYVKNEAGEFVDSGYVIVVTTHSGSFQTPKASIDVLFDDGLQETCLRDRQFDYPNEQNMAGWDHINDSYYGTVFTDSDNPGAGDVVYGTNTLGQPIKVGVVAGALNGVKVAPLDSSTDAWIKTGRAVETSTDDGLTWNNFAPGSEIPIPCIVRATTRVASGALATDITSASVPFKVSGDVRFLADPAGEFTNFVCGNVAGMGMFKDNNMIQDASGLDISHVAMSNYCFANMFKNCTALTQAPALPETNLAEYAYEHMFEGCINLESAPALMATIVPEGAYSFMFTSSGLKQVATIGAESVGRYGMQGMYEGCGALSEAPAMMFVSVEDHGLERMFSGCPSLSGAVSLTAKAVTTLTDASVASMRGAQFREMFHKTRVTSAVLDLYLEVTDPLTLETYPQYALADMFSDCTDLASITIKNNESIALFTNESFPLVSNMMANVASAGEFSATGAMQFTLNYFNNNDGADPIYNQAQLPSGWTLNY